MLKMIHDLDEMLYPTYPDAVNIMWNVGAQAAIEKCGLKTSFETARDMIDLAIQEKRNWMAYLVEYGVDPDQFHCEYHANLDHRLIQPYPKLSRYFAALGGHASHVMLTHSAAEWASRTVEHIGLRSWFPEDRILAWEKYKELKSASTKGFEMALEKLDAARPDEAVFADDSIANLVIPSKMGITTVWVSHNRPLPAGMEPHVDHVVESIEVFMKEQVNMLRKTPSAPRPLP